MKADISEHAPRVVITAMGGYGGGEYLLPRLHGETKNPKAEAVAKMTDLMGEMGRNGLRDVEILGIVQRGYAVQSATCVQDCPFVMADNNEDALRRKLGGRKRHLATGTGQD